MDNNIQTILWLLMIGFAVAAVAVYCSNRFLGGFVRALLAVDATSPESALTMKELGVKSNPLLRAALGRKGEYPHGSRCRRREILYRTGTARACQG